MKRTIAIFFLSLSAFCLLRGQEKKTSYHVMGGSFDVVKNGVRESGKNYKTLELEDTVFFNSPTPGLGIRIMVNGVRKKHDVRIAGYEGSYCFKDLLADKKGRLKKQRNAAYRKNGEEVVAYFDCLRFFLAFPEKGGRYVSRDSLLVSMEGNLVTVENLSAKSFFLDIVCVTGNTLISAISQDRDYSTDIYFWPGSQYGIEITDFLIDENLYFLISDEPLLPNGADISSPVLEEPQSQSLLSLVPVKISVTVP